MTIDELFDGVVRDARQGSGEVCVARHGARIVLETEGASPAVIGCPSSEEARRQLDELLFRATQRGAEVTRVR